MGAGALAVATTDGALAAATDAAQSASSAVLASLGLADGDASASTDATLATASTSSTATLAASANSDSTLASAIADIVAAADDDTSTDDDASTDDDTTIDAGNITMDMFNYTQSSTGVFTAVLDTSGYPTTGHDASFYYSKSSSSAAVYDDGTGGINNGHSFNFTGAGASTYGVSTSYSDGSVWYCPWNIWTSNTNWNTYNTNTTIQSYYMGSFQDIVENTLGEDGYPVLNKTTTGLVNSSYSSSESLAYLFDADTSTIASGSSDTFQSKKSCTNLDASSLLTMQNGYYYFDSDETYASIDGYDTLTTADSSGYYTLDGASFSTEEVSSTDTSQGFFPFNSLDEQESATSNTNTSLDHFFGLHMSTSFVQKDGGTANDGKEMVFEFTGDDDVWIFVDDALVGDVGGIHSALEVDINFATGEVTVYETDGTAKQVDTTIYEMFLEAYGEASTTATSGYSNVTTTTDESGTTIWTITVEDGDGTTVSYDFVDGDDTDGETAASTFADNTEHTLDFFYLERGSGASNLHLEFNLREPDPTTLTKVDQDGEPVEGAGLTLLASNDDYSELYLATADAEGNSTVSYDPDEGDYIEMEGEGSSAYFVVVDGDTGSESGALVTIAGGDTGEDGTTELTDVNGSAVDFTLLDYDHFVLVETTTPDGYQTSTDGHLYVDASTGVLRCANIFESGVYTAPSETISIAGTETAWKYVTESSSTDDASDSDDDSTDTDTDDDSADTDSSSSNYATFGTTSASASITIADLLSGYTASDGTSVSAGQIYGLVLMQSPTTTNDTNDMYIMEGDNATGWSYEHITYSNFDDVLNSLDDAYRYVIDADDNGDGLYEIYFDELPGTLAQYSNYNSSASEEYDVTYTVLLIYEDADGNTSILGTGDDYTTVNRTFATSIYVTDFQNRFVVQKVDENGAAVDGAIFALFPQDEVDALLNTTNSNLDNLTIDWSDVSVTSSTDEDGVTTYTLSATVNGEEQTAISVQSATTDTNEDDGVNLDGVAVFEQVSSNSTETNGVYYLIEVEPPAGFAQSEDAVVVLTDGDGVHANAGTAEDGVRTMVGAGRVAKSLLSYVELLELTNNITNTTTTYHNTLTDITISKLVGTYNASDDSSTVTSQGSFTWTAATGVNSSTNVTYSPDAEDTPIEYGPLTDDDTAGLWSDAGWASVAITQYYTDAEGTIDTTYKEQLFTTSTDEDGEESTEYTDITELFNHSVIIQVTDESVAGLSVTSRLADSGNPALLSGAQFTYTLSLQTDEGEDCLFGSEEVQVSDVNGYLLYTDDEGNEYWYYERNQTLYTIDEAGEYAEVESFTVSTADDADEESEDSGELTITVSDSTLSPVMETLYYYTDGTYAIDSNGNTTSELQKHYFTATVTNLLSGNVEDDAPVFTLNAATSDGDEDEEDAEGSYTSITFYLTPDQTMNFYELGDGLTYTVVESDTAEKASTVTDEDGQEQTSTITTSGFVVTGDYLGVAEAIEDSDGNLTLVTSLNGEEITCENVSSSNSTDYSGYALYTGSYTDANGSTQTLTFAYDEDDDLWFVVADSSGVVTLSDEGFSMSGTIALTTTGATAAENELTFVNATDAIITVTKEVTTADESFTPDADAEFSFTLALYEADDEDADQGDGSLGDDDDADQGDGSSDDDDADQGDASSGAYTITATGATTTDGHTLYCYVNADGQSVYFYADVVYEQTVTTEEEDGTTTESTETVTEAATLTVNSDGTASFTLKAGQTLKVYGLEPGIGYTVTETASSIPADEEADQGDGFLASDETSEDEDGETAEGDADDETAEDETSVMDMGNGFTLVGRYTHDADGNRVEYTGGITTETDETGETTTTYDESATSISGVATLTVTGESDPSDTLLFENEYTSDETYLANGAFTAQKTLSGRDWADGDTFTFVLTAVGGAPMPTGAVTEIVTSTNSDGDEVTTTVQRLYRTITVSTQTTTDEETGETTSGLVFTVTTVDANGNQVEGTQATTLTYDSSQNLLDALGFGAIVYTQAGTFTYTIVEQTPSADDALLGVNYSHASYLVTVEVTDNGNGELEVSSSSVSVAQTDTDSGETVYTPVSDNNATFTNTYSESSNTASVQASKVLGNETGAEVSLNGAFSFTLTPVGGFATSSAGSDLAAYLAESGIYTISASDVPMPKDSTNGSATDTSAADGTARFTDITFAPNANGGYTYVYQLVENASSASFTDGLTYDATVYYVVITCTTSTTTGTDGSTVAIVTPTVSYYKQVATTTTDETTGEETTTYSYELVTTTTEAEDGTETTTAATAATFTNVYEVENTTVAINATKTLDGYALSVSDTNDDLTFTLAGADDATKTALTDGTILRADQGDSSLADQGDSSLDSEDSEEDDASDDDDDADQGDGSSGSDDDEDADDESDDADGATGTDLVTYGASATHVLGDDENVGDGTTTSFSFDELIFTKAGTYTFTVSESTASGAPTAGYTYDSTVYTVTVVVTDEQTTTDEDGTTTTVHTGKLTATVTYSYTTTAEDGTETTVAAEKAAFTNTYRGIDYAAEAGFAIEKTLALAEGSTLTGSVSSAFQFTVTALASYDEDNKQVTSAEDAAKLLGIEGTTDEDGVTSYVAQVTSDKLTLSSSQASDSTTISFADLLSAIADGDDDDDAASIVFTADDAGKVYTYTVTEEDLGATGFTYDTTTYGVIISVAYDETTQVLSVTTTVNKVVTTTSADGTVTTETTTTTTTVTDAGTTGTVLDDDADDESSEDTEDAEDETTGTDAEADDEVDDDADTDDADTDETTGTVLSFANTYEEVVDEKTVTMGVTTTDEDGGETTTQEDADGATVGVGDVLTYTINWTNDAVDSTTGLPAAAEVTVSDTVPTGTEYVEDSAAFVSITIDGVTYTLDFDELTATADAADAPSAALTKTTDEDGETVEGSYTLTIGEGSDAITLTVSYTVADDGLSWTIADAPAGATGAVSYQAEVTEDALGTPDGSSYTISNSASVTVGSNDPRTTTQVNSHVPSKTGEVTGNLYDDDADEDDADDEDDEDDSGLAEGDLIEYTLAFTVDEGATGTTVTDPLAQGLQFYGSTYTGSSVVRVAGTDADGTATTSYYLIEYDESSSGYVVYTATASTDDDGNVTYTKGDAVSGENAALAFSVSDYDGDADPSQTLTWVLSGLSGGESVTITFTVAVTLDTLASVDNQASVDNHWSNTTTLPTDDDSHKYVTKETTVTDEETGETSTTTEDVDGAYVSVGDTLTYTVQWYNDGTGDSSANDGVTTYTVTVSDTIPENVEYVAGSLTIDGTSADDDDSRVKFTYDDDGNVSAITWTFTGVALGAKGVVTFDVLVVGGESTTIDNTAYVNNTSTETTHNYIGLKEQTNEELQEKSTGLEVGDVLDYSLSFTVPSDSDGTATVVDTLTQGLEYVADGSLIAVTTPAADEESEDTTAYYLVVYDEGTGTYSICTATETTDADGVVSYMAGSALASGDTLYGSTFTVTGDAEDGGQTLTWELEGLSAGDEVTVSFSVQVTLASLVQVGNSYTVEGGESNTVYTPTDVTSTKSVTDSDGEDVDGGQVSAGDTLTYTVQWVNTATDEDGEYTAASKIVIVDTVPDGTTYVAESAVFAGITLGKWAENDDGTLSASYADEDSGLTYTVTYDESTGAITWTIAPTTEGSDASIAAGAKGEVSFEVTVDGTDAEITNSATVYSDDSSVTTEGVTTYTPVKTVTSDDEDADGSDVAVGDVLSYSITAVNNEGTAAKMVITDAVPSGTVLVANSAALSFSYDVTAEDGTTGTYTGTYAYDEEQEKYVLAIEDADGNAVTQSGDDAISVKYSESDGTLTWTLSNVPAGATVTAGFSVEVTEDAVSYDSITNQASVQIGDDSSSSHTTGTTEVTPPSKTVSTTDEDGELEDAAGQTVAVGDELTYTIRWANDTGGDVDKVTVTDTVPTGTVLVVDEGGDYVISDGGSYDENTKTITWTIEPGEGESAIEAGATGTVSFTVVVTADAVNCDAITNTATVQVGENGPSTSTTTTSNDVDKTRLVLSKTVLGGSSSNEDEQFRFTIVLKDADGNAVSGTYAAVIVTPAASEDETATSKETTVTFDESGTATVKLAAGQSITIYSLPEGAGYTVTEAAADGYTTTAAVDGKATALTGVPGTDEDGETTVTGYSVSGALTDVDDDTTATTVAFTNACTASKSVSVTSGEGDDATITEDADGTLVGVGDVLTYSISWVNDALDATTGEAVAAKVVITDTVPRGTVLVEGSAVFDSITGGSYTISADGTTITDASGATVGTVAVSNTTITWTIDTAAAGASGTVSFAVTVDSDALGETDEDEYTISNSATVQVGEDDPEQTLTVTNTVPKKEGEVVGNTETGTTVDEQPDELKLGDVIEYTVSFTNADGDGATATVVDELDAGLEYLAETTDEETGQTTGGYTVTIDGKAASSDNVTFTSEEGTLTWVLTDLPADATVVITFQVQVTLDSVANVVNSATVNGHSSNVITTPTDSDSHKMVTDEDGDSAEGELVGVGDTLTYTIQWYNDGAYETEDGTAESSTVVITDTVPDGTVLVEGSVTINGNVADASEYTLTTSSDGTVTITWTFENVALGAKGEVGFTVTVTGEEGTISNTAYVNDSPTVDSSTTYVPVKEQTNEELQDAESLAVGDVLSYKLSFTVPESTDGTATVVDELAQGLEYLEGSIDGVEYGQETTVYVTDEEGTTTEQTATLVYSITSTTGADGTVTTTYKKTEGSESTAWSSEDGIIYTFAASGDADDGGQTLTWAFAGLTAGQSVVITFNAQVTLSSLVYVDNSYTVDGSESSTTTTPTSTASTKSVTDEDGDDVDGGQVSAGDELTYTIQWVNATKDDDGEYVAADVTIKDTLPEGVELDKDNISGTEWTSDLTEDDLEDGTAYYQVSTDDDGATVITWTIPNVAAGAKGEVSFTVTVTGEEATIANKALVNNAETNTTAVYTPVKTVTDEDGEALEGDVAVGDVLSYSITAVNNEGTAAKMVITDAVPSGTVLVAGSAAYTAVDAEGTTLTFDASAYSISESNGTITWTFEEVPAGATITATFQVTVTEDALKLKDGIENSASVEIGDNEASYSTSTTGTTVGTGSLTLSKAVVGTDDTSKEFTFTISLKGTNSTALTGTYSYTKGDETGTLDLSSGSATVSLKADESITITGLPEGASYTITEAAVSGYTAYTTYDADDASKCVQSSMATGTVLAAGSTVAFTNVYSTSSVTSAALEVQKVVKSSDSTTTYEVGEGDYSFTLKNTQKPEGAAEIADQTVSTLEDGVATFKAYTFSVAGTYVFTLSEANTTQAGITRDATVYTITYVVTDNGNGTLSVSDPSIVDSSQNAVSTITFTNVYDTTQVGYTISGSKAIDNTASNTQRTPKNGEFTFTLTEVDAQGNAVADGVTQTTTNGGSGFAFNEITYSAAGTYYYQVSEAVPDGATLNEDGSCTYNGLTYDTTVYTVVVMVAADKDGVLSATANYQISDITFTNTYTPTSTTYGDDDDETALTVTKVLEGRDWAEGDSFSFTLAATEATVAAGGYSIGDGGTSATVAYEAAGDEAETGSADLLQTLADAVMTLLGGGDEAVAGEATATGEAEEATASGEHTASFGTITFTKAGTYTFTVSEVIPDDATQNADGTYTLDGITYDTSVKTITVTVVDDGEGALSVESVSVTDEDGASSDLTFTNTYEAQPATAELTATKEVVSSSEATDYVMGAGDFSFTLSCVQAPAGAATIANQTVENLEDGLVTFDDLEFTVAGTYVFTLSENSSDEPGIEKDGTVYTITYTVTDDGAGNLVAGTPSIVATNAGTESTVNSIVFTNYYDTTQTSYAISGVKAIKNTAATNRTAQDGEFTFVLADGEGTVLQTVKNAGAAFSFSAIDYTEAGTYTYKVYEQAGEDGTIAYDSTVYEVTVTVTESDGKLVASANYETSQIVFTNTYTPTPATAAVQATKVLQGRTLGAGEFTFQLTDGTSTYTATNAADGSVTFGELSFTDVGTYTYTLSEVVPDDDEQLGGVTYDETTYTVTITVIENEDTHALEATVTYATSDGEAADVATFTNAYEADEVTAVINGTKTFDGYGLSGGEFTFVLVDESGEIVGEVENTADGSFAFDELTFSEAGTYVYTVQERYTNDIEGVSYDKTVYTVTYEVVDTGAGSLTYTRSITSSEGSAGSIDFVNPYNPDEITVSVGGTKHIESDYGRTAADGEFTFVLTEVDEDGNVVEGGISTTTTNVGSGFTFADVATFTEPGTKYFRITEAAGDDDTFTYSTEVYTVKVVVTGTDALSATYTIYDAEGAEVSEISFTNIYAPMPATFDGAANLTVTKTLSGRDWLDGEVYAFTLAAGDDATSAAITDGVVTLPAATTLSISGTEDGEGYSESFGDITFAEAGTYTFTVSEVVPDEATAENNYTSNGVTFDTSVKTITVTVADDGDGKLVATLADGSDALSFTNTYAPEAATDTLTATKVIGGGYAMSGGEFTFVLADADGNVVATADNASDGDIVFDELTFSEAGTYTYTLIERYANTPGVSFDRTVYTITYEVTDDGHGSLVAERTISSTSEDDVSAIVFTNPYDPDAITVSIGGIKYLTGDSSRSIADGEFTFALTEVDEDGNVVEDGITATTVNTGNGFTFADVATFTEPGVKYFKIAEVAGSDSTITYDDVSYTVKVEVTGTDVLTATYSLDTDDIVFTNIYTPEEEEPEPEIEYTPVSVKISGAKTLSGKTLAAGDFTFVLADGDGTTVSTAANSANGSFSFNALTFTQAGTYTYTVSEAVPDGATENADGNCTLDGVTYDTNVYTVVIDVGEDAASGSLVASVSYLEDGTAASSIVFANTYTPSSISVTPLAVTKVLEGRDLQEGEFSFTATVADASGQVVATLQGANAADGTVSFPDVALDAAGTYTVTVTEDVPEDDAATFLTYDTHTYTYEIVVTYDSSSGAYSASVVEGDGSGSSTFTNIYDVPEDTKTVTDADGNDVDGSLVSVGDELVYTIGWVNDAVDESGANVAATVVVTDTLPTGTVLVDGSITGGGVYDEDTRTITWTIEAAACETGSVSFAVEVDDTARTSDEIENTAHVQVGDNEHAQATNTTTVYVPVKTVTDAQNMQEALVEALVGQELTYTIAYRNAGSEAQAMTITDVVPTGTVLVDGSISDGGVYDAETNTITWYFASVEPSDEAQYVSFNVTVTEDAVDTTIENQASIQLGENDPYVVTNTTEVTVPSAALAVSKTVAGALADASKEFTFTVSLADSSGTALEGEYAFAGTSDGTTPYSGTIGDGGTLVLSDGGSVTIEGLPAGTQFSVVEEEAAGYTADVEDGTVSGTLVAGETAQAAFTNTYDATGEIGEDADVAISATKTLTGRSLKAGEFEFQIADTAGNVVSTGTNAADGTIAFSTISYTAESLAAMVQAGTASVDGNVYTIQYIASEVTDALPDGVSATTSSVSFTVTLVDDGEGNLVASVSYPDQGDGSLAFVNSYEAEDVAVSFNGTKVLALDDDGLSATLADIAGAFTFTISGSEGAPLPDETTATNDEAGNISFGTVTIDESCLEGVEFAEDGTRSVTFTYTVAESGSYAGVTNDAGEQTFTVTVTQDADGTITVATSAEDGVLFTFTNTYGADATSVVLAAGKVLDGADLASGQFTFQLLDADGNVLQTVTNDADGAITFDAIEYTQVGTYTYTIVEVDDGQEGVTYDTTVHTVTVKVTDDGEGQLVASVSYDGAESSPSFVNSYSDDGDEPDDGDDGDDDEPDEPDDGDDGDDDDEPDEPDDGDGGGDGGSSDEPSGGDEPDDGDDGDDDGGDDDGGDDGSSDEADDDDSGDSGDESDDGDADADGDGDTGGSASKTGDAGFGTSLLALLMALLAAGGAVRARRMRRRL